MLSPLRTIERIDMALVRHLVSGAIAETDSESVARLIESGQWEPAEAAHKKRAPRKAVAETEE